MTAEEFVPAPGQIPKVFVGGKDSQSPSPGPRIPDTLSVPNDATRTDSQKAKLLCDKWWLLTFLSHTAAYLGASGWINYAAITNDKLAITDGTLGPIDTEALIRLCGAVGIGLVAALVAFGIVVFIGDWYYWSVIGATLLATCVPFGLTTWKSSSNGGNMYYIGLVIFGSIALFGVFFMVRPPKRRSATIEMFRCFRSLLLGNQNAYWLIIAWTIFQAALELWCTLSVAAVVIRFQPNAQSCSSGDSLCGWGMVIAIASAFVWAQLWLATTLSEVINATLAAGVFSKASREVKPSGEETARPKAIMSVGESLKFAGYRSLGSLARNAFFSDTVEMLVWPFDALDRYNQQDDYELRGMVLALAVQALGEVQQIVTIAIREYGLSHHEARPIAQCLVKRGNNRNDLRSNKSNTIGAPINEINSILRLEVDGAILKDTTFWKTGLGAFMGSHISKSLLTAGAIACGLLTAGAIYSAMIFGAEGPDIRLDGWDWAIVAWSFLSAYTITYHLLMVIDACVCSLYFMMKETPARGWMRNVPDLEKRLYVNDKVTAGLAFPSLI